MSSMPSQVEEDEGQSGPVPLLKLPGVLFGRRWWWSTLIVIAGMIFLGRLGFWQLDRLEERRAANAAFEAQFYSERVDLNGELEPDEVEELADRRAVVDGRFDYEGQIILREQSLGGRPGVHLVTPLVIEGKETAVLVDQGWIPAEEVAQGSLETFNEFPEGPIEGVLKASQTLSGGRETIVEEGQEAWYRIDIEAIESQSAYDLLPVYLVQSPGEGDGDRLPLREEVEPDLSEGSHLGYAVQWFLFAVILGIGYGRYVSVHDK